LGDANGHLSNAARIRQRRIEGVNRPGDVARTLTEAGRIRPRLDDMPSRDLEAPFERTGEGVFIEIRPIGAGVLNRTLRFEPLSVPVPRRDDFTSLPTQFFAALVEVSTPEGSIPFVQPLHVLDPLKRSPGHPRRSLAQLVSK
jgi:hypothetical protein